MLDRKYVFINFNLLKERSPDATVTGMVSYNLYAITKFALVELSSRDFMAFKIFKILAFCTYGTIAFILYLKNSISLMISGLRSLSYFNAKSAAHFFNTSRLG